MNSLITEFEQFSLFSRLRIQGKMEEKMLWIGKRRRENQDNVKPKKSDAMIPFINCIRKVLDKDTEIMAVKAIEFMSFYHITAQSAVISNLLTESY